MGEVKDIMDKIKKYGNMKVVVTRVQTDLPHLYPMYSAAVTASTAEMAELLGEIEEDLKQLVQENDWPKRDNLPVENYD